MVLTKQTGVKLVQGTGQRYCFSIANQKLRELVKQWVKERFGLKNAGLNPWHHQLETSLIYFIDYLTSLTYIFGTKLPINILEKI